VKIEVIFFDVGNVLVEVRHDKLIAALRAEPGINSRAIDRLVDEDELIIRYRLGQISSESFFSAAKTMLGFHGSLQEMENLWCSIFKPLENNMDCVKKLSARFPLCLISNTNECHCTYLESRFDVFSYFNCKIYSHLEGLMKPDPRIYKLALKRMNVSPLNALFIDDEPENIRSAESLGLHTIHLEKPTSLGERLSRFLGFSVCD
jgi:putative hydrolase of the HAD superfamily